MASGCSIGLEGASAIFLSRGDLAGSTALLSASFWTKAFATLLFLRAWSYWRSPHVSMFAFWPYTTMLLRQAGAAGRHELYSTQKPKLSSYTVCLSSVTG